jgi:photosystem II stability/assembly factor-like uncharacterized protein
VNMQRTLSVLLLATLAVITAGCGVNRSAANALTIDTGPTSHVHTLHVTSDGSLILGDQDGLWHAQAGGHRWTTFGSPLNHLMPICVARLGQIMLVCTTGLSKQLYGKPNGLWRSTDGGRHWHRAALPDLRVIAIATNRAVPGVAVVFAPADGPSGDIGHGGIWVTTNTGKTWLDVNRARAFDALTGLALLPGRPFTILFSNTQTIWRSADGGHTWRAVTALQGHPILSLAQSPLQPAVVFAGLDDGVWISNDSGATWQLRWSGGPTSALAPAADRIDDVYAYMGDSLYRLNGIQRREVREPVRQSTPAAIAVDPRDADRVYLAYSFPLRIYESNDGGRRWLHIL